MVRGIGVDIIEIGRIRKSIEELGHHFVQKIFTEQEVAYCSGKPNAFQHFAARFAAKEALSKAISTGWSGEFRWKDVEVMNEPSGNPVLAFHGTMKDLLSQCAVFVSLSHSDDHVVAMVVIEETRS
ncbi:MAG: holo-ACP synthase [Ignavibacteriae bacterium]|nr:holo-ACP synthase [Ignavibacteriota bacterium]